MFTLSDRYTIDEIHQIYRKNLATPTEVTKLFITRSKEVDKDLHAVLRYTEDLAYEQAKICDEILLKSQQNQQNKEDQNLQSFDQILQKYPLFGIPYNLKDNILVEGQIATSCSKIIQNFKAPYSATVYKRIFEAGGILISQSNLDEWAVGSSTENSAFGATKNPFDTSRVPGGSSGGPAAAVASGQAVFSLGSDTGGSIRVPAAFCDVVGVKPTYGFVPRYGVMPLASSLDQVGPFTQNVKDNLTVLQVIAGKDEFDQTSIEVSQILANLKDLEKNLEEKSSAQAAKKIKIGIAKEYFSEGMDEKIEAEVKAMIQKLEEIGCQIIPVSLPLTKYGLAVYYTMMTVETATNLQRYDGVRFGEQILSQHLSGRQLNQLSDQLSNNQENQKDQKDNISLPKEDFELYTSVRKNYLGDEPKRRIMLGTFTSSAGYYDAYYNQAAKVKEAMSRDFAKIFENVDALIAPTTPEFPFKFGEKTQDPIKMYLSDALVYGANLCKLPAISVPLGLFKVDEESPKLPTGIQVITNQKEEEMLYLIAALIEKLKS